MDKLQKSRIKINTIDSQMARLFEERMQAVKDVVDFKMEHDLAILDSTREKEVIGKNMLLINNSELKPYFKQYIEAVMSISKEYQSKIMNDAKKEQ